MASSKLKYEFERLYGMPAQGLEFQKFVDWKNGQKGGWNLKGFKSDRRFNQVPENSLRNMKNSESRARISVAMQYVGKLPHSLWDRKTDAVSVAARAKEVRYIFDALQCNSPECTKAINSVLGYKRFSISSITYIYRHSAK